MKDRIEFRFTVATGKVDSKAMKALGKVLDTKLDRLAETFTKAVENVVDYAVEEYKKEGDKKDEE